MPRKKRCRQVESEPGSSYFKPRAIPMSELDEVELTLDEIEAIRLVDMENQYQEAAAQTMAVSRQTLGRILKSAHRKMAEALVVGKAIKVKFNYDEITSKSKTNDKDSSSNK